MPGKIDIAYAIGLEPEKAVQYFQAKGYDFSFDWYDMWQDAHAKAFTVAKAMQADVLEDIRTMVDKSIKDGITLQDFQKDLTPKLQKRGWWGIDVVDSPKGGQQVVQLGSPTRLETIYRTNTQTAYNVGRYRDQVENVSERPYWQYVAVMDTLTRPTHAALNGKVFKASDPFWHSHYPPNGFNCRCRVRALTKDQIKEKGLEVLQGEGHLSEKKVEVARGVERPVTVFKGYGINMAPDPGWSYNPGETDWEPIPAKYEPDIREELEKAEKSRGLAKEYPVKTYDDIQAVLQAFNDENPGIFYRGFKKVEIVKGKDYFMATDSRGYLAINNRSFAHSEDFNPARELKDALINIRKEKDLTFHQEYAVESLWHEILHNRARGWRPSSELKPWDFNRKMMETLNQFVARHTYPTFLESLGGLEAHGAAILEGGFGYTEYVRNFRAIIKAAGLNEVDTLESLQEVSYYADWLNMTKAVAEALANQYGDIRWAPNFERALGLIERVDPTNLDQVVRDILLN